MRLKNIENKSEKQLKAIEDKTENQLKAIENNKKNQSVTKKTEVKKNLYYDSNHNFYKCRLSNFSQMSSVESKFEMLEIFYSEFISLKFIEAKGEKTNNKFTVLNNATNFYNNELISEYRKVYEKESKDGKIYGWKQK